MLYQVLHIYNCCGRGNSEFCNLVRAMHDNKIVTTTKCIPRKSVEFKIWQEKYQFTMKDLPLVIIDELKTVVKCNDINPEFIQSILEIIKGKEQLTCKKI